jgi:ABC-type amino acid transport substrate-binding protein
VVNSNRVPSPDSQPTSYARTYRLPPGPEVIKIAVDHGVVAAVATPMPAATRRTQPSRLEPKKLGVQTDTTGQIYAEDNKAANGYEIVVFDDGPTTLTGVLSGRVAAAINDNGTVYDFAKDNPTTTVSKEFNTGEQYGFMVQKDNANAAALLAVINDVIKTSKTDGSYDTIYKKWFGVQPA